MPTVVATTAISATLKKPKHRFTVAASAGSTAMSRPEPRISRTRALASVLDSTRADLVGAVESGAIDVRAGPEPEGADVAIWSLRLRLGQQDRVELVERMNALLTEFRDRSTDATDTGVRRVRDRLPDR